MAVDMDLLEAQLHRLGGEARHIAQRLRNPCAECSPKSITGLGVDELNKFITNVKHATTQLHYFSQRWNSANIIKTEDVKHLEEREAKICKEEASLKATRIELGKEKEILKARAAEVEEKASKLYAMDTQIAEKTLQLYAREAQSKNLYQVEHQILSLKGKLALILSQTDRQTATMSSIHKDIEGVDHHARIMDRQLEGNSAEFANISDVSTGLDANISEVFTGLNANISEVFTGLNANISKASTGLNALSTKLQYMQVTESNATEELRKATVTGSKAREALQKIIVCSNATLFNDSTTKRGLGLGQSSPEKPHPKRRRSRHSRAGSAGAAEVLANVEAPELLTKTIQTFGSPRQRIVPPFNAPRTISGGFDQLAPFAGRLSASYSGPSSSAVNPISSSPSTFISSSQSGGSSDLAAAHIHVRDVWRQVEFPADWTEADSAKFVGHV